MPEISVIIPCFNQGEYLDEAIQSVLGQTFQDFEIIVVNDGSTDSPSIKKLNSIDYPRTRVVHSHNLGLPGARNLGIRHAIGEFILPLDADDRIAPAYLALGHAAMKEDAGIGIVYCKAEFFGEFTGPWNLPPYQFPDILISPRIHCCGFFRKADWAAVEGYCEEMVYGWEDYDLWLSFIEMGRRVHCIPETLFYYRQHGSNMTYAVTHGRRKELIGAIYRRHKNLYDQNMPELLLSTIEMSAKLAGSSAKLAGLEKKIQSLGDHLARSARKTRSLSASRSWRATALLRRLDHVFSWRDGVIANLKAEACLFIWRIFVHLPFCERGKSLRNQIQKIGNSGIFNAAWYADSYEPMPGVDGHPILHYLLVGAGRGCDPSPFFSTSWYSQQYLESADSGINPLIHYMDHGAKNRSNPNPSFDTHGYMAQNRGIDWSEITPLAHYLSSRAWDCETEKPLVSVVIPCYNYGKHLMAAVDSALEQTWRHLEVVIVDDGSDEPETVQIIDSLRRPRTKVVRQGNLKLPSARNNGIAVAAGEFICCLDADDMLEPTYIEKCLSRIAGDGVDICGSWQRNFGDEDEVLRPDRFDMEGLLESNRMINCALFRKRLWEKSGGYDPTMVDGYEDWEFWIHLASLGARAAIVPEPLFLYRKHGRSMIDAAQERHDAIIRRIRNKYQHFRSHA